MIQTTSPAAVLVVGSANQDYIVRVPVPPGPGETVMAQSLLRQPGGKGANQAVAAARLRSNVSFIASIGDDADGAALLRELRSEGVDTSNVEIINRSRTGLALVSVYDSGENSITVIPGANFELTADRVTRSVERLTRDAGSAVVVVQAELVTDIITATAATAERAGARLVLNLAPYQPLVADVLAVCDPLVVNETEASALVGWKIVDAASAARATEQLITGVRSVVVTVGAEGAYWAGQRSAGHVPAPSIAHVVDTTGAGDAFVGALASCLARGESLRRAVEIGVLAGSFAVTSPGAQSSYPTLSDLGVDLGVDPARPPAMRAGP